jgi:hypothetical protein
MFGCDLLAQLGYLRRKLECLDPRFQLAHPPDDRLLL